MLEPVLEDVAIPSGEAALVLRSRCGQSSRAVVSKTADATSLGCIIQGLVSCIPVVSFGARRLARRGLGPVTVETMRLVNLMLEAKAAKKA